MPTDPSAAKSDLDVSLPQEARVLAGCGITSVTEDSDSERCFS
jgi:hypothetical protein